MIFGKEDECDFVSGPHDGERYSIPQEHDDWMFANRSLAFEESVHTVMSRVEQDLADEGPEAVTDKQEGEISDRFCEEMAGEQHQDAQAQPGGASHYRRVPGERNFKFVGHVGPAEHRAWKVKASPQPNRKKPE
jgi:hypothetical protein